MYLFILLTILIATCIYIFFINMKRYKSDIVEIKNIEMVVTARNQKTNTELNDCDSRYVYNVKFESLNEPYKTYISSDSVIYIKYQVGDKVILQEIIYKNGSSVFNFKENSQ